ncbi:MAG: tRNA (adenosine(37)-N6)-threonylcarbamoyltransferase complex ATPase subunit type 1 TsaE, partial [Candidatus Staskawiczbacteria bacterium RIFCSPHIGHO2_01_FULL_41_41]
MKVIHTNNFKETQMVGQNFAREILAAGTQKNAVVLALSGDLGSGKTTFLQGFAKGLGIEEVVNSPTFIVMKRFKIYDLRFKNFYHIDCYRLDNEKDVEFLHFQEIISNPKNIVAIEWPEKIAGILPQNSISITFK